MISTSASRVKIYETQEFLIFLLKEYERTHKEEKNNNDY
jgi:hypothetical protein